MRVVRFTIALGPKLKQDLAPLMQLGRGPWMHAFEMRFLLSEGAKMPFGERESLKSKSAHLVRVRTCQRSIAVDGEGRACAMIKVDPCSPCK
jgi:hypothetical protein